MKSLLFALIAICSTALPTLAEDCKDCIERKEGMCATECKLVPSGEAVRCQRDCIWQYCTHRCEQTDLNLLGAIYTSCTECLDSQFNLCETECPTGTDRMRALCKNDCAKQRCESHCKQSTTNEKKTPQ